MSWIDLNDMFLNSEAALSATGISSVKQMAGKNVGLSLQTNAEVELGGVEDLWLVIIPTVTGTGAGTITFSLVSDTAVDLVTSAREHYTTAAIVGTSVVAGTSIAALQIPAGSYKKYMGVKYVVSGTVGAMKIDAFLTNSHDAQKYYAAGSTIGA